MTAAQLSDPDEYGRKRDSGARMGDYAISTGVLWASMRRRLEK
jgi:hypothetical protein